VQAIMDLACPQLVFNRTILMGDAAFVIRPIQRQAPRRHRERLRSCGRDDREAGIIRIARSLAAVGVESRAATHELWARSRPVARALANPK